jgi:hypothetical protein
VSQALQDLAVRDGARDARAIEDDAGRELTARWWAFVDVVKRTLTAYGAAGGSTSKFVIAFGQELTPHRSPRAIYYYLKAAKTPVESRVSCPTLTEAVGLWKPATVAKTEPTKAMLLRQLKQLAFKCEKAGFTQDEFLDAFNKAVVRRVQDS